MHTARAQWGPPRVCWRGNRGPAPPTVRCARPRWPRPRSSFLQLREHATEWTKSALQQFTMTTPSPPSRGSPASGAAFSSTQPAGEGGGGARRAAPGPAQAHPRPSMAPRGRARGCPGAAPRAGARGAAGGRLAFAPCGQWACGEPWCWGGRAGARAGRGGGSYHLPAPCDRRTRAVRGHRARGAMTKRALLAQQQS